MNLKNRRIIVTGGAGVIGKILVEKLFLQGAIIKCFDVISKPDGFPVAEYCQKDLTRLSPVEFTDFNPDFIFHLAAALDSKKKEDDFLEINFSNNVLLSHKVVNAARHCKNLKKFIFASTYLIYDTNLSGVPQKATKLKETNAVAVRNIYGAAKYYTEKELEFAKFPSFSARIFRVYGRGSRDFISKSVRSAINSQAIELILKESSFDYIFADDAADGLIKLTERDAFGTYNLGTGQSRKIKEIASILKIYFPDVIITELPKKGFYENSCADITKFKKAVNWLPKTSLEEGIKHLINYEIPKKI
ncbi:MAG: NAD(P)-dependent oxidoreductase [Patescibacteria group bacterium]